MNQTTPHSSFKKNLWTYAYNISKIICIWILLQTLVFKFWLMPDALAESQEIFRKVSSFLFATDGYEMQLRIWSWILELIVSVLLMFKRTTFLWAIWVCGLMAWAIWLHTTVLGYDQLFGMAVAVFLCGLYIVWYEIKEYKKQSE